MFTSTSIPANVFPLHSAEWLYDEVMRHIEPDLMLRSVKTLEGKYLGELDDERSSRMARYEQAFALFDEVYGKVAKMMMDDTRALKRKMHAVALQKERAESAEELESVERSFRTTRL